MKKLFSEIPCLYDGRIVIGEITEADTEPLKELIGNDNVYKYLPTFLFERKYEDIGYVISHLYTECFQESIILGVYYDGEFCGIAELYGFRDEYHKISVGYRLLERFWGQGIASEALALMIDYLYNETEYWFKDVYCVGGIGHYQVLITFSSLGGDYTNELNEMCSAIEP